MVKPLTQLKHLKNVNVTGARRLLFAGASLSMRQLGARRIEMTEFQRGALIAIGLVARLQGGGPASEVLNEMGLCNADVSGLDDFDRENLARAQGELFGKINLRGLRGQVGLSNAVAEAADCMLAA